MRGNRGFALVLTLVVTALMVAVLTELIHQVYVDTSLSRGFRDGQQASLLAESGITAAEKYIQFSFSGTSYTKPLVPITQDDETGTITITFAEESGKICLNELLTGNGFTMNAIKRLNTNTLKVPADFWDALADWIDSDDIPRSGGAEKTYYMSLKAPYHPYLARNDKLLTFSELSLVKGFTKENGFTPKVVTKLAQCVTVYPSSGGSLININTAPQEVIAALDANISDVMASQVVDEVIKNKRPFTSVADLARIPGFGTIAIALQGHATVKGDVFRITSKAQVRDSARTIEAVWQMSNNKILSWQEY